MGWNNAGDSWMHLDNAKLSCLKYHYVIILIVTISLILRLYLKSNYLDDWDSVQFILGLKQYSIIAHQPHPPGYPVYIFLGRITNHLFNNGIESFTFMSAFFGSLALVPTYLMAREFVGYRAGILSAIILSLAPAEMLFSEVVMSDIVSMFFISTTAYLLYKGLKSSNYLYLASFILAITIGVRQTDFLLIMLLLITLFYIKNIKKISISILILLIGIALWLIPVIIVTGLGNFIMAQSMQGKAAVEMGTLNSLGGLNLSNLVFTIKTLIGLFIEGWSFAFFIFALIVLIAIFYKSEDLKKNIRDKRLVFLLGWLIPYFLLFIFVTDLYISRYLLPVFPPLAIIFGSSMVEIYDTIGSKNVKKILALFSLIIIIFMGYHAISSAYAIHTTEPAPVAAAEFIKNNYDPNGTVIVVFESFRHLQYYLPEFKIMRASADSSEKAYEYLTENKTVIYDVDMAMSTNKIHEFTRNHNIYPKHEFIKLYEYSINKKSEALYPLMIGYGWNAREDWGNIPTRWMQADATITVFSPENRTTNLSLQALSFYRNRTLEIYSGDKLSSRVTVPKHFIKVIAHALLAKGTNVLRFHVPEGCERPSDKPELNNPDSRCLAVAVQNLSLL